MFKQHLLKQHTFVLIAVTIAALLTASTTIALARPSGHVHRSAPVRRAGHLSSSIPAQGIYGYCAPAASEDVCAGRLKKAADAGFTVVVNYEAFDADSAELKRYMAAAEQLGIKLIWPMKDRAWWGSESLTSAYPKLAANCGCSSNDAFLRYVVGLVKGSPATWGYYVADEQSPSDATQVAAFSRQLRALDPGHKTLAIAAGDDSVAQLAKPYAAAADMIGADSYPVGTGQPLDRVGFVGRQIRSVARATHRQSAMALQAFSWACYPDVGSWSQRQWPTRTQMRAMRDMAIRTAHPSLILWYSYFDIRQSPDASKHLSDLAWAATGDKLT
jgi:hypothetical protein